MYSGYVMMGYYWALQAAKAEELLASGEGAESEEFYRAKLQTAERTVILHVSPRFLVLR